MDENFDSGIDQSGLTRGRLVRLGLAAAGAAAVAPLAGTARASTLASFVQSATPKPGGTIKAGFSDAISSDSLDPITTFSMWGGVGKGGVYDQLIYSDLDWKLTPMLAVDWSHNPSITVWTFKLRKGVEFHNGKPFTAADVAYTIRRNLSKKEGGGAYPIFAPVLAASGVRIVDRYTIAFHLRHADAFFPNKMAYFYGHIYQNGTKFDKLPQGVSPGTGPFKAVSWTPAGWVLKKNPNYWMNGRPYLDQVTGVVMTELSTKAQSVVSGGTHLIDPIDWSGMGPITKSSDVKLFSNKRGAAFLFGIDGSVKPYSDPRVRQAIKSLVNRDQFVRVVCRGDAVASADSCIHPQDPFYPKDLKPTPYDPEKAKSLLKAAGYPNGFDETIWTSNFGPAMLNGPLLLQQQWNKALNSKVVNGSYDNVYTKRWLVDRVVANYWWRQHPSTMLPFMYKSDGAWNEARYKNPRVDKMIQQAQSTTNVAKQKQIIGDILHTYDQQAAAIWPMHIYFNFAHRKELQGLVAQPSYQLDLRGAYLTK